MNDFDLHIHSTFSDGQHSIKELLTMADKNNLNTISVTDHDTIDGVEEAIAHGLALNIRVIPGMEISAEDENEKGIHLLGYGIDHKNQNLLKCLREYQTKRIERAKKMVAYVQELGFVIDWDDVIKLANGSSITSPHIAKTVLARKENTNKLNGISDYGYFIETYLIDKTKYDAGPDKLNIKDAIELIHQANGVSVWAHPVLDYNEDYLALEQSLQSLIKLGLDGIEIFMPAHTENDTHFLQTMAEKYNLLITAGSDFHESVQRPADKRGLYHARTVGEYETYDDDTVKHIISRLDRTVAKLK